LITHNKVPCVSNLVSAGINKNMCNVMGEKKHLKALQAKNPRGMELN